MQIGFVGLGRMGGNVVARSRRDSDHDVVACDVDASAQGDDSARVLGALRNRFGGHAVRKAGGLT